MADDDLGNNLRKDLRARIDALRRGEPDICLVA